MLDKHKTFFGENFSVYNSEENNLAGKISTMLEKAMFFCAHYFSLVKNPNRIRVVLVDTRDEFDRLVRDLLEVEIVSPAIYFYLQITKI